MATATAIAHESTVGQSVDHCRSDDNNAEPSCRAVVLEVALEMARMLGESPSTTDRARAQDMIAGRLGLAPTTAYKCVSAFAQLGMDRFVAFAKLHQETASLRGIAPDVIRAAAAAFHVKEYLVGGTIPLLPGWLKHHKGAQSPAQNDAPTIKVDVAPHLVPWVKSLARDFAMQGTVSARTLQFFPEGKRRTGPATTPSSPDTPAEELDSPVRLVGVPLSGRRPGMGMMPTARQSSALPSSPAAESWAAPVPEESTLVPDIAIPGLDLPKFVAALGELQKASQFVAVLREQITTLQAQVAALTAERDEMSRTNADLQAANAALQADNNELKLLLELQDTEYRERLERFRRTSDELQALFQGASALGSTMKGAC